MSAVEKPKLRNDLRMRWLEEVDARGRPMCELEDPATGRTVKIRRPDYNFLLGFDGAHDFDDAMARAANMGIAIKPPEAKKVFELLQTEGFLIRVASLGEAGPPPAAAPGGPPRPPPSPPAPPPARPPAAPAAAFAPTPRPAPPAPASPVRPSSAPPRPVTAPFVVARETQTRFPVPPAAPPEDADFVEPERTIADPRMARIIAREEDPETTPVEGGGPPESFDDGPTIVGAGGWQPRVSEVAVDRPPEGPLPKLRPDLLVRERPLGGSVVYEMVDPLTRRTLALYPAELAVARELDGNRDLFALLEIAREKGLGVPPAKLATFIRMLQQSGFLDTSSDGGLGRNEFSVMAPLPMAPVSSAPLAVIPQAEPPALAAPLPSWNAEERRLFQVALSLFRRGLVDDAENRLQALLEIDPNHKEARTLLEVVQRDKQRAMTLADVQRDLAQVSAEAAPAIEASSADAGVLEPPTVSLAEEPRSEKELRRLRRRASLRRWAIRFVVLGVLVGAAAFIPYPLRARGTAVAHPRDRAVVRAPIEGVLDRIETDEGQTVQQGQTVAVLYDRDLRVQFAQRDADRQQAEAQLAMLRAGARPEQIEAARRVLSGRLTEVGLKERECDQLAQQVRQRVIPEEELRSCRETLAGKRSEANEARAQLAVVSAGARPEEIQGAEAKLRRAVADLAEIQAKLDQTTLRSPIKGVVTTAHFRDRLHEKVGIGDVVCEVARLDVMRVEIHVPEADMDLPRVGQFVRLRFSNIPERSFQGRVIEIGQQVETETVSGAAHNFVRVVSEVPNPGGVLRGGLTGFGDVMAGDATLLQYLTREVMRRLSLKILN